MTPLVFLAAALLLTFPALAVDPNTITGATRVMDGDTLDVVRAPAAS